MSDTGPEEEGAFPEAPISPLDRRPREGLDAHRAFLLYAMQKGEERSLKAVARALARDPKVMRAWRERQAWEERIAADPEHESHAVAEYRHLYLREHGESELPEVAAHVKVPIGKVGTPRVLLTAADEALLDKDKAVKAEIARRKETTRAGRQKSVQVLNAALNYIVNMMAKGKAKANLRDIPGLMDAKAKLEAETLESDTDVIQAEESYRVKRTRESGGDILEALAQDIAEQAVIVETLRTRREVGASIDGHAVAAEINAIQAAATTPLSDRRQQQDETAARSGLRLVTPEVSLDDEE